VRDTALMSPGGTQRSRYCGETGTVHTVYVPRRFGCYDVLVDLDHIGAALFAWDELDALDTTTSITTT
jgi:hypothetical protein